MSRIARKIIKIDEDKCNGCGICADACHEGAIQIIGGKAKLVKESYCDGLGDCIGPCPQDAITIEERYADEYDEEAVQKHLDELDSSSTRGKPVTCPCPGSAVRELSHHDEAMETTDSDNVPSRLSTWPVQITLVPPNAPFLNDSDLLITADCVPFAFPDFHNRFIKGRVALVGCPKLDDSKYYIYKLTEIFKISTIKSITVVYMEVPCCAGLVQVVHKALIQSGKQIPLSFLKIGIKGDILDEMSLYVESSSN
ncbi:MAG: 4Fe-4S binding protein [Candidatus Aegiribacteria sp.]|nr:4Fe-4S binding protein [Candidatus Aegiribacteria sp.]